MAARSPPPLFRLEWLNWRVDFSCDFQTRMWNIWSALTGNHVPPKTSAPILFFFRASIELSLKKKREIPRNYIPGQIEKKRKLHHHPPPTPPPSNIFDKILKWVKRFLNHRTLCSSAQCDTRYDWKDPPPPPPVPHQDETDGVHLNIHPFDYDYHSSRFLSIFLFNPYCLNSFCSFFLVCVCDSVRLSHHHHPLSYSISPPTFKSKNVSVLSVHTHHVFKLNS